MIKFIFILTFIFTLSGCLPKQPVKNQLGNTLDNVNSTNPDDATTIETASNEILWLNAGLTDNSVTLDVSNKKSIYLIGKQVHEFLSNSSNFSSTFCMEVQFPSTSNIAPKRLRVKLTPQFSKNLGLGEFTRYFLVNTANAFGNNICDVNHIQNILKVETEIDLKSIVGLVNGVQTVIPTGFAPVHDIASVCTNCTNILASSKVIIFKMNTNNKFDLIDGSELNQNILNFRIDLNSKSSNGQNSCTNSECISLGFDCCQQGQCVKEKDIKISGVNLDPAGFAIAEKLKTTDENWYKDYQQFYFSCLEAPPITTPSTGTPIPTDPTGDAQAELLALISDFECVEELDKNTEAEPFHRNPINVSATYTKCNITDSSNNLFYENVLKRLYTNCGCVEKTDFSTMVANCPAYTYKAIFKNNSSGVATTNIDSIVCISPPVSQTPLPFQDLNVPVSSRSAPHRFFNVDNKELDVSATIPTGLSTTQEGEEFKYIDNFFLFPRNGSFNMNSILGQMTTQLNQAQPARMVKVEFDKEYLISTLSGQYNGCPTCGKDSWFNNFTAFPFTNNGLGAQSIGFTTRRDTFSSNTSLGNYEDTIFSRACFVPPTMLPFSHATDSNSQTQRQNRLKTQAALFINGYQRDWYGFNKGALIGSFDGVTWFAVGSGRLVKSTSDTLYLAINAPFADLASPTTHIVAVQEFDFLSTAALFDYDPTLEINSSAQNQAASCQESHKCETDAHCISTLGWEYVCADVGFQQTSWPNFNPIGAKEEANQKRDGSIIDFLQQATLPPGSGSKRCVYRGAGSPCRMDYENITDEGLRKNLTCAPNFYCASLNIAQGFNKEVSRFGKPLEELLTSKNHLFGQDANILGRPLDYINKGTLGGLPIEVRTNLEANLSFMDPTGTGQFGLCRPGKKLPTYQTPFITKDFEQTNQHKTFDSLGRTDFISQIGSCNSALYTEQRYSSCPMLDDDGNYINTQDSFLNDSFLIEGITNPQNQEFVTQRFSFAQNSCGLESLSSSAVVLTTSTGEDLKNFSAFRTIEASSLKISNTLIDQTLARDGCLRKAGAVCHTDLDCSPNRLHASVVDLVSASFFGNDAEKTFYQESLICGQAKKEPPFSDPDFLTFNPHNNRCCRPVGEDLTMFTEDSPRSQESKGIDSSVYGSLQPTATNRYSRYSSVESTINSVTKKSNIIRPTAFALDADNNKSIDRSVNITNANQWKTIHTAAAKTCCGGSWVRKFDDGSNNWALNRSSLDINNFKCINQRTALASTEEASAYGLNQFDVDNEKRNFCFDARNVESTDKDRIGNCHQYETDRVDSLGGLAKQPRINEGEGKMRLSSSFITANNNANFFFTKNLFSFHPFIPLNGQSLSVDKGYVLNWSEAPDESDITTVEVNEERAIQDKFLVTKIPSFVTFDDISELNISLTDPVSGASLACTQVSMSPVVSGISGTINPSYSIPTFCNGADGNAGLCDTQEHFWLSESGLGVLPPGMPVTPQPITDVDGNGTNDLSFCPDLDPTIGQNNCCYFFNPQTRVVRAALSNHDILDVNNYGHKDISMEIEFTAVGTLEWEQKQIANLGGIAVNDKLGLPHRRTSKPGNDLYYLKKLAKLEYIGIPQMTYEPIYCNDNYQNLVPGIFKPEIKTVMDILDSSSTFIDSGVSRPWQTDTSSAPVNINMSSLNQNLSATQEILALPPVFSDNQFKCCLELGTTIAATEDSGLCCSGFTVQDEDNDAIKICKLPAGTDLNVYFNKFVSGEGIKSDVEGVAHLTSDDFDSRTGEPKLSNDIATKLRDLGKKHCEFGTVRNGGAYGEFETPISTLTIGTSTGSKTEFYYSILDENSDNNTNDENPSGVDAFNAGFRWNHHAYCGF